MQAGKRAPYCYTNETIYDREGNNANNKTIAIAEPMAYGYGVRNQKMKDKSSRHKNNDYGGA